MDIAESVCLLSFFLLFCYFDFVEMCFSGAVWNMLSFSSIFLVHSFEDTQFLLDYYIWNFSDIQILILGLLR